MRSITIRHNFNNPSTRPPHHQQIMMVHVKDYFKYCLGQLKTFEELFEIKELEISLGEVFTFEFIKGLNKNKIILLKTILCRRISCTFLTLLFLTDKIKMRKTTAKYKWQLNRDPKWISIYFWNKIRIPKTPNAISVSG